jgi:nitrate reductase NapE
MEGLEVERFRAATPGGTVARTERTTGDLRPSDRPSRAQELSLFLFLTVVLAPVLAVAIVGGYGFLVWMYQLFAGPPGPPAL